MWDDPEIVAHQDCRYDVGLEVAHVEPDGEVGRFEFRPTDLVLGLVSLRPAGRACLVHRDP